MIGYKRLKICLKKKVNFIQKFYHLSLTYQSIMSITCFRFNFTLNEYLFDIVNIRRDSQTAVFCFTQLL